MLGSTSGFCSTRTILSYCFREPLGIGRALLQTEQTSGSPAYGIKTLNMVHSAPTQGGMARLSLLPGRLVIVHLRLNGLTNKYTLSLVSNKLQLYYKHFVLNYKLSQVRMCL